MRIWFVYIDTWPAATRVLSRGRKREDPGNEVGSGLDVCRWKRNRRGKWWFFWSDNSSWEIGSTISVDTNDSLADFSEFNEERESETNSESDSSWHDDVKWGWRACATSTVRDTCTLVVLCSVARPFLWLHSYSWRNILIAVSYKNAFAVSILLEINWPV